MNATLQTIDLARELELLVKIVASKPTIPVLANVMVQAEGNGLRLATTDLEIGLVTFCPATVHEPGTTTLPVKHLVDVVKLLSGEVTLTTDHTSARLACAKYKSRLQTQPANDYPIMPSMKDLPTVEVQGLQDAIRRVRFAVSAKGRRYFLDGALLSFTEAGLLLAATDGHRLSLAQSTSATWEHDPIIIPSKTLDKLVQIPGDILLACGERHIFFVVDGRMLFSRMIDGTFPDYGRIIPKDTDHVAVIPRLDLLTALQRVVLTADIVVLAFTPGTLAIQAKSAEVGDATEHIEAQYDGEAVISLNGTYLLEFLSAATGQSITVRWKNNGALLFTDGDDYSYVQMPMRSM